MARAALCPGTVSSAPARNARSPSNSDMTCRRNPARQRRRGLRPRPSCLRSRSWENRYGDLSAFGAPALIADQVFHGVAILGEPCANWRDIDLGAVHGRLSVDGAVRGQGNGRELLGGPFEALAWLAGSAEAAAFGGLRAGQIIMLGSVCTPIWLDAPGCIEVSFDGLGAVRVDLLSLTP